MAEIPKIMHFVWLGKVPKYAEFAISTFKSVNPEFEVRTTFRSRAEVDASSRGSSADKLLERSIKRLGNWNTDSYVMSQMAFYGDFVLFEQILSDVLRVELLNEYGGIYLDCDTFPLMPFPDELLKNRFFTTIRESFGGSFRDNFFMGKAVDGTRVEDPFKEPDAFLVRHMPQSYQTPRFLYLKRRFFEGSLIYGERSFERDYIVDHYCAGTWRSGWRG